jgi:hypothetical protein
MRDVNMTLLPKSLRNTLPPLYATEDQPDPLVQCKFFTAWSRWSWYILEFDGEDTFFGWVEGFEGEYGYFSLAELLSVVGPYGLRVERDLYFEPQPMSQVSQRALSLRTK